MKRAIKTDMIESVMSESRKHPNLGLMEDALGRGRNWAKSYREGGLYPPDLK